MRIPAFILFGFAAVAALAADGPDELQPGHPTEVYVAPGHATTVQLRTDRKVAAISIASPIVSYKYDKELNQLEITPAARAGGAETNLNLRIGADVYILLLKVVTDVRAQYLRTFALAGEPAVDDEAGLSLAPPLPPAEVDVVGAARMLERAEGDPVFRAAHPAMRIEALGRRYSWNGCLISLEDLAQFADRDLLVFRVRWVNRTDDALYLDATQYGLLAGDRRIPITARYKVGTGPVIYPGQLECVFLAVQGYRLSRRNDWRLALPPEADSIERLRPASP